MNLTTASYMPVVEKNLVSFVVMCARAYLQNNLDFLLIN